MAKGWRKQQSQDRYFQKAKSEGYRARSAYKLIEINARFHLLGPGSSVLDLGAAPGSWSQVALRLVGKSGRVVAVDILPVEPLPGLHAIQGDITRPETIARIEEALPKGADAVISDVAPSTSGISLVDHARSIELSTTALEIALRFLHPQGSFVVKVFQGEDFPRFLALARRHFQSVQVFRPEASRRESVETFVVCLRLQPRKEDHSGPPMG